MMIGMLLIKNVSMIGMLLIKNVLPEGILVIGHYLKYRSTARFMDEPLAHGHGLVSGTAASPCIDMRGRNAHRHVGWHVLRTVENLSADAESLCVPARLYPRNRCAIDDGRWEGRFD